MKLENRVAIVTGAGRGIGRGIAIRMAKEGAAVVVNYCCSAAAANDVVAEIEYDGGKAFAYQANVGDLGSHAGLLNSAIEKFGSLDILVNNAGIEVHESVLDASPSTWDRIHDVNLKGIYFLSSAAAALMKKREGRIICISSVHDVQPLRERAIYSASKGGLLMLVKSLALELAPLGINVTGVSPGAIITDMNRASLEDPERRKRLLDRIPAGRLGGEDDVSGVVAFLASPDAAYIHGATIYVDGGLLLS